jgi:hypothetical protein
VISPININGVLRNRLLHMRGVIWNWEENLSYCFLELQDCRLARRGLNINSIAGAGNR